MCAKAKEPEIRPFKVEFSDAELASLKARVKATVWPDKETVPGSSQGVPLETQQKMAQYWASSEYDWRKCEAKLNAVPNFITEIDGLDIHFMHVKSKHENAMPILVSHGWPGSIIEQMKLIEPLTNPTAHGGSASDAFDIVISSMPGYGFSGKPTKPGWDAARIAKAWGELMSRLGYEHYVAAGGDWGGVVVDLMALQEPPGLIGIHTNFPGVIPPEIDHALQTGGPMPEGLSPEEQRCYEQLTYVYGHVFYAFLMATRPQSMTAYADSPIGLAALMTDHDLKSMEMIARVFDGKTEGLTRDDVIDNITLYWLTNTAMSGFRLYMENKVSFFATKGVAIPVAVSVFPDEIYEAPKSWSQQAYPKLIHYNRVPKGGHFAAWEQPKIYSDELRDSFRSMR